MVLGNILAFLSFVDVWGRVNLAMQFRIFQVLQNMSESAAIGEMSFCCVVVSFAGIQT